MYGRHPLYYSFEGSWQALQVELKFCWPVVLHLALDTDCFKQPTFEALWPWLPEEFVQTVGEIPWNNCLAELFTARGQPPTFARMQTAPGFMTLVISTTIFLQKRMLSFIWKTRLYTERIWGIRYVTDLGLICITRDKNKRCKNFLHSPQICVKLNNFYQCLQFSSRSPLNIASEIF